MGMCCAVLCCAVQEFLTVDGGASGGEDGSCLSRGSPSARLAGRLLQAEGRALERAVCIKGIRARRAVREGAVVARGGVQPRRAREEYLRRAVRLAGGAH